MLARLEIMEVLMYKIVIVLTICVMLTGCISNKDEQFRLEERVVELSSLLETSNDELSQLNESYTKLTNDYESLKMTTENNLIESNERNDGVGELQEDIEDLNATIQELNETIYEMEENEMILNTRIQNLMETFDDSGDINYKSLYESLKSDVDHHFIYELEFSSHEYYNIKDYITINGIHLHMNVEEVLQIYGDEFKETYAILSEEGFERTLYYEDGSRFTFNPIHLIDIYVEVDSNTTVNGESILLGANKLVKDLDSSFERYHDCYTLTNNHETKDCFYNTLTNGTVILEFGAGYDYEKYGYCYDNLEEDVELATIRLFDYTQAYVGN